MTIDEIKTFPTTFEIDQPNGGRFHESLLRSYQILEKIKELLQKKPPPDVILEIVDNIECGKTAAAMKITVGT